MTTSEYGGKGTMNTRGLKSLVAIVVAIGMWTSAGFARSIPTFEGFEDLPLGDLAYGTYNGVTYTGTLAVIDWDVIQGQKSLHMSSNDTSSSLVVAIDPAESKVWTLIYAKPAFNVDDIFELMAPEDDTALMFGVNTNGAVIASDGAGWATNEFGIAEDTWVAFAINTDYDAKTYDLFAATNASFGGSLQRVFEGLAFNTDYTGTFMTALEISTDLEAFVDGMTFEISDMDVADANALYVTPSVRRSGVMVPPPAVGAGDNTFGGALGDLMKAGLADGDIVRVYFGDGDWEEYLLNGGSWQGGALAKEIDPSQGILLAFVGNGGNKFIPHTEPGRTEPFATIFAGDNWNMLAWTAPAGAPGDSSQWYFGGIADDDDVIIVHDPDTGRAQTFLWKGGEWRNFPNVSAAADYVMPQNRVFWYRGRTTPTDLPWPLVD